MTTAARDIRHVLGFRNGNLSRGTVDSDIWECNVGVAVPVLFILASAVAVGGASSLTTTSASTTHARRTKCTVRFASNATVKELGKIQLPRIVVQLLEVDGFFAADP
jgi:hypothetical protein